MRLEADVRIVVTVPFTAAGATDEERAAAAAHAETVLVEKLRRKVETGGAHVARVLVEEVREQRSAACTASRSRLCRCRRSRTSST